MADTVKRSQLIQQQIANLLKQAPQPYSEAEKNQIMKGRKKQADIDQGRATIEARNKQVTEHNKQIELLNQQLGEAEATERKAGQEDKAAADKAERERNASPLKEKFLPFAGGAAAGGLYAALANSTLDRGEKAINQAINEIGDEIGPTDKLTNSQANRSRAIGAANAAEQFRPASKLGKALKFGAKGAAYGVPAALVFNEWSRYDEQAKDPNATQADKDMSRAIANGLLGVGTGIGGEGAVRAFNPRVDEGVGRSMMRIETARELARRHDDADIRRDGRPTLANAAAQSSEAAQPQSRLARALASNTIDAEVIPDPTPKPALPAPSAPETGASPPMRHGDRLREAATAAGAKAGRTKAANVDAIRRGLTAENSGAVAKALNLPETAERKAILQRLREISTIGGKMAIPLAVGSYMAATGDSEAADASLGERAGNVAQNFGIGASAAYGGSKLMDAIAKASPALMGGISSGLSAMTPAMIDDMTSGSPEELNMARNTAARTLPELMQFGAVGEARDMAQVPPRSPANAGPRLEDPALQNRIRRMAGSGASPDQIAAFLNGISF
jgi:hypothetical protein